MLLLSMKWMLRRKFNARNCKFPAIKNLSSVVERSFSPSSAFPIRHAPQNPTVHAAKTVSKVFLLSPFWLLCLFAYLICNRAGYAVAAGFHLSFLLTLCAPHTCHSHLGAVVCSPKWISLENPQLCCMEVRKTKPYHYFRKSKSVSYLSKLSLDGAVCINLYGQIFVTERSFNSPSNLTIKTHIFLRSRVKKNL